MKDASETMRVITEDLAARYLASRTGGEQSEIARDVVEYEGSGRIIVRVNVVDGFVFFVAHRESGGPVFTFEARSIEDLVTAVRAVLG